MPDKPGYVDGRYYAEYVDTVRALRSNGDEDGAVSLLLRLVDATEAESRSERSGVAPWYYEQLAIAYRKLGLHDEELQTLQRFARQPHARGASVAKLLDRLEKRTPKKK